MPASGNAATNDAQPPSHPSLVGDEEPGAGHADGEQDRDELLQQIAGADPELESPA